MLRTGLVFPLLIFLLLHSAKAQPVINSTSNDSITIAANPDLQAGWLHRFIFGSLWRDVWTTPVNVMVLHPDAPIGKEYSFTPFNQDSVSSLPSDLSILLPQDIVNDQRSTLNPFAPLVIVPILQSVGLPYREARLVVLQDSTLDNEINQRTKNTLGILEWPWHIPYINADALHSDNFAETPSMLQSLEMDSQCRVNELQYLKARLIDIFIGDWDRSADKWLWIKAQTNIWEPVPIKHRQGLVRVNGFLPTIADLALPELENCGENISSVENLTLTGRTLDRRLLISYSKQTWDSLASWIQSQISDSVLMMAVSKLPISIRDKEGKSLLHLLQSRRTQLPKAADEYYKLSSEYVDIRGSNKAERTEIRRIGKHLVSVAMYDRSDTLHSPFYQRFFFDDITKEIRVLLLGGDDFTVIEGEESSNIKIIIDGGEGKNVFVCKNSNSFNLNSFSLNEITFYDMNPASRIAAGYNTQTTQNLSANTVEEKEHQNKIAVRDWGSEWSFSPWLDINPDDGLFVGGGPILTKYGYRIESYAQQIGMRAGLATRTGRYRLDANGEFRDWFRGVRIFLQLHASQLDLSNFFGLGNKTTFSQSLANNEFYKVDQRQIFFHASLNFSISPSLSATIGSTIKLVDNNPKSFTLLDSLRLQYYNKSLASLNANASLQADTRDNKVFPMQGIFAKADIFYLPKSLDNDNQFYKFRGEVKTYFTPHYLQSITIAMRTVGEKVLGSHPFFESAFLGGSESLRGFERQRFAGDASVLGGAEIRARVGQIPFIVPLWAGISGFAETGRVFLDGEQSNRWHNTFGGGFWFSIIKQEYIISLTLAHSEDECAFYATLGFMF